MTLQICNTLAEQFAFNSSSDNYSHMFNRHRLTVEKTKIDFDTNVHYSYNDVFTLCYATTRGIFLASMCR